MKVLITKDYGKKKMDSLRELGYELIYVHERQIFNTKEIEDIDILVCYNPFKNLDISKLSRLKWIQLSSIGFDHIPLDYIKKSNIVVTNNKGGYSIPMGEWIVLKILEIYKQSKYFYIKQNERKWKINTGLLELCGKTIGFIGTGTIAQEGAKRLQGFEAKIYGLNTNGRNVKYFHKCFPMSRINEMLGFCDVVVCTIPHTDATYHLLNQEKLNIMKDDSVFINVSRGPVVDEKALIDKIREGKFLGVALDVFEKEPLDVENPLWDFENVYVTPHNSWVSEMRNDRRFDLIYENMKRFKNGEELLNIINIEKGY